MKWKGVVLPFFKTWNHAPASERAKHDSGSNIIIQM